MYRTLTKTYFTVNNVLKLLAMSEPWGDGFGAPPIRDPEGSKFNFRLKEFTFLGTAQTGIKSVRTACSQLNSGNVNWPHKIGAISHLCCNLIASANVEDVI